MGRVFVNLGKWLYLENVGFDMAGAVLLRCCVFSALSFEIHFSSPLSAKTIRRDRPGESPKIQNGQTAEVK